MTLTELEAHIASLNSTLLRAPGRLHSPHAVSRHAAGAALGRQKLHHEQHQHPKGSYHQIDDSSGHDGAVGHRRHAVATTSGRQQLQSPQRQQSGRAPCQDKDLHDSDAVAGHQTHAGKPAMTAWQKLTSQPQAAAMSDSSTSKSSSHSDASVGQRDGRGCTPNGSPHRLGVKLTGCCLATHSCLSCL